MANVSVLYDCKKAFQIFVLFFISELLLSPQLLNLRKKVEDIWANYDTTFLRISDSTIYSCGLNAHGQLGVENDDKCVYFPEISESLSRLKIKSISAGTQHVTLLDEQGLAFFFFLRID